MGKPIYTTQDKTKAILLQSELQSENIETIVLYGSGPGTSSTITDTIMGKINPSWQVVAHDEDVEKAKEFLAQRKDLPEY